MKIPQYLVITDIKKFLKGDYSNCFNLFNSPTSGTHWINCGEIIIDIDPEAIVKDKVWNCYKTEQLEKMKELQKEISNLETELEAWLPEYREEMK